MSLHHRFDQLFRLLEWGINDSIDDETSIKLWQEMRRQLRDHLAQVRLLLDGYVGMR